MLTNGFLVWLRKNRNLTLKDLADSVGVSIAYISYLEKGQKPINSNMERRIITAMGLDQESLMQMRQLYHEVNKANRDTNPSGFFN